MSESGTKQAAGGDSDLLTLSEVSKRTKISMPTLQRYKKEYQHRIPSVGEGRKQRYPVAALEVFKEIKKENIGRRGRPRKAAAAGAARGRGKKKAAARAVRGRRPAKKKSTRGRKPAAGRGKKAGLLTLTEISKWTNISYPTLVRYVKLYGKQLPHEGSGRRRRFYPAAVEVFNKLRAQSGRGRKAGGRKAALRRAAGARVGGAVGGGALARRLQSLEKAHAGLEKQIKKLIKQVEKPLKVTVARGR